MIVSTTPESIHRKTHCTHMVKDKLLRPTRAPGPQVWSTAAPWTNWWICVSGGVWGFLQYLLCHLNLEFMHSCMYERPPQTMSDPHSLKEMMTWQIQMNFWTHSHNKIETFADISCDLKLHLHINTTCRLLSKLTVKFGIKVMGPNTSDIHTCYTPLPHTHAHAHNTTDLCAGGSGTC